jgi:hypothetical protein
MFQALFFLRRFAMFLKRSPLKFFFLSSVYRGGGTFCRRLFDALKGNKHSKVVNLPESFRADIRFWCDALSVPRMMSLTPTRVHVGRQWELWTDATPWGGGACFDHQWWSHAWSDFDWSEARPHRTMIHVYEFLAVMLSISTWGRWWAKSIVNVHSDNSAVVAVISSRKSDDEGMMKLLRRLYFLEIKYDFFLTASHIPGSENVLADALSRGELQTFRRLKPKASGVPSVVDWCSIDSFSESDLMLRASASRVARGNGVTH